MKRKTIGSSGRQGKVGRTYWIISGALGLNRPVTIGYGETAAAAIAWAAEYLRGELGCKSLRIESGPHRVGSMATKGGA